jgi:hypothetical protein
MEDRRALERERETDKGMENAGKRERGTFLGRHIQEKRKGRQVSLSRRKSLTKNNWETIRQREGVRRRE